MEMVSEDLKKHFQIEDVVKLQHIESFRMYRDIVEGFKATMRLCPDYFQSGQRKAKDRICTSRIETRGECMEGFITLVNNFLGKQLNRRIQL